MARQPLWRALFCSRQVGIRRKCQTRNKVQHPVWMPLGNTLEVFQGSKNTKRVFRLNGSFPFSKRCVGNSETTRSPHLVVPQ